MTANTLNNYRDIPPYWGFPGGSDSKESACNAGVQFSSVAQLCPTLCDPMDCSTPGLPVHHQLAEFTQTQCASNQGCHPAISSSVVPFSSSLQSFPASGSFLMSWLLASGGQSTGASVSSSVLPMVWSPYSPRDSQESSPTPQFKSINASALNLLYGPILTSTHDCWKNHGFDCMDLCWQRNVSIFNMLSRFVIAFLPRSKHLLISWLQSPSAGIFECAIAIY